MHLASYALSLPAVHDHGPVRVPVGLRGLPDEGHHLQGDLGHPVVGPARQVEQQHEALAGINALGPEKEISYKEG